MAHAQAHVLLRSLGPAPPTWLKEFTLFKFLPVAFLVAILAGCGSNTAKPPPKPRPTPTVKPTSGPSTSGAGLKGIIFGTSLNGTKVQGASASFSNPSKLAWQAHLNPAPTSKTLKVNITRLNGGAGPFPKVVWSGTVTVKNGQTMVTGQMSKAQMKARQVKAGGKFGLTYLQKGTSLAQGNFEMSSGPSGASGGY